MIANIFLIDVIPLFGALVTLMVLVSILLRSKKISIANFLLVVFLLICFFSLTLKFINESGYIEQAIHLLRVNYLLGILRPPLFFLYIYFAIEPKPSYSAWHALHFVPFMVVFIYLLPYFLLPAEQKLLAYQGTIVISTGHIPRWYPLTGLVYSIAYLAASWIVFRRAVKITGFPREATRKWILVLLLSHVAFLVGAVLRVILKLGPTWDYFTFYILSLSIIIACITLLMNVSNPFIEANRVSLENRALNSRILEKLNALLQSEKLYLNDQLRIKMVSEKLGLPEYVLSQAINENLGITFSDVINQLRVEEAKRKLSDPAFDHLTIEAIGIESGFNTKAAFYNAFRKITGVTPREFKLKPSK